MYKNPCWSALQPVHCSGPWQSLIVPDLALAFWFVPFIKPSARLADHLVQVWIGRKVRMTPRLPLATRAKSCWPTNILLPMRFATQLLVSIEKECRRTTIPLFVLPVAHVSTVLGVLKPFVCLVYHTDGPGFVRNKTSPNVIPLHVCHIGGIVSPAP